MKVLLTGGRGFVGRWLERELSRSGHEAITPPSHELDVTDRTALEAVIERVRPDAIAHLAAVSFAPEARADPAHAFAVNVGGTLNLLEAIRRAGRRIPLLVTGSSEVYGRPHPDDLPLKESALIDPRHPYALSKAAQEGLSLAWAARHDLPVVVTRSFNHSGPGQRPSFVLPALAGRVLEARRGRTAGIRVGNLDVRRDFTDVRDVVRAYRLLLEALESSRVGRGDQVVNVASGRAVPIRWLLDTLSRVAGVDAAFTVDASLVRVDDPPEIRGDASLLHELTGWQPEIHLERMLGDLWQAVAGESAVAAGRREA